MSPLRRPSADRAPADPAFSVVDTTEVRWFVAGPVPEVVRRWFTATTGITENRRDTYLADDRIDVGVKHRGEATLELKVRRRIDPAPIDLGADLAGCLETWRKWTPADGLVAVPPTGRWVDVDKSIVKRRFAPDGTELAFAPGQIGDPACDVEVAAVVIGTSVAWTLAFAAFGPPSGRHANMLAARRALWTPSDPPGGGFDVGRSMGYPEWIAVTLAESDGARAPRCGAVSE